MTPSVADVVAQILTLAADDLDRSATIAHPIGGHEVPCCMTDGCRDITIATAVSAVLRHVHSGALRESVHDALQAMQLPPATCPVTVAEYANQLRALAA